MRRNIISITAHIDTKRKTDSVCPIWKSSFAYLAAGTWKTLDIDPGKDLLVLTPAVLMAELDAT